MYDCIDETNVLIYAAKNYNSPVGDTVEFYEDINRVQNIKTLIKRYNNTGELRERLILNHIITLTNVFGPKATVRMLFLKMKDNLHILKPFLIYLNIMPEKVIGIGVENKTYYNSDIKMDQKVIEALRKI